MYLGFVYVQSLVDRTFELQHKKSPDVDVISY